MEYKAKTIVNLQAATWVVNLCYSTQFTHSQNWLWKDSASPTTNLTARHWYARSNSHRDMAVWVYLADRQCCQVVVT